MQTIKLTRTWLSLLFALITIAVHAQCPVNIGFETGSLTNWTCYAGGATTSGPSLNETGPLLDHHTIVKNSVPQTEVDKFGKFPTSPPNGSKYSIRLGNNQTGAGADRVSYTFRIPDGVNSYSIVYHYAVVMQSPGHPPEQQPKFTAKVFDVDRNSYIECSSFEFIAAIGLPGFASSVVDPSVLVKNWTPVTLKLNNRAGSTIRLEFTAQDCTQGGHFGYAYVDVDENCSSPVRGNQYCRGDTALTLQAPLGFESYKWYSPDFSTLVDSLPFLHFAPPPPPNTPFAVVVQPYPQMGCLDTLYTTIQYSPDSVHLVVKDYAAACESVGVDVTSLIDTANSSPLLTFTYFTNPQLSGFLVPADEVKKSGTYYIRGTDPNGCTAAKGADVVIFPMPTPIKIPVPAPEINVPYEYDLSAAFVHEPGVVYTYWGDSAATVPLPDATSLTKSGTYYIKYTTTDGCGYIDSLKLKVSDALISADSIPNAFSPNGDGINDVWRIPVLQLFPDCFVDVFSRAGQLVFRSAGYHTPWDGKFRNADLPLATYYYVIRFGRKRKPISGSVTIIK